MYEGIAKRRSTRKFKKALSSHSINTIKEWMKELVPLYEDIGIRFHVIEDGEKVKTHFNNLTDRYAKVESPHYIIITSEEKEGYLENAGYMGEQLILKMTTHNIGTCWVGRPFRETTVEKIITMEENHRYVIMIAFGQPKEDLKDMELNNRKRKKVEEFIDRPQIADDLLIDALVAAPSAVNTQPCFVQLQDNKWHFYMRNKNILLKKAMVRLNKIDLGIGICHVAQAITYQNKHYKYYKDSMHAKNNDYIGTLEIN